jgi:hypothetical protein
MGTIGLSQKAPFRSRAKAAMGVMMAVVALGGAAQAATPDSASAMKPVYAGQCMDYYSSYVHYKDVGNQELTSWYFDKLNLYNCWGEINGL